MFRKNKCYKTKKEIIPKVLFLTNISPKIILKNFNQAQNQKAYIYFIIKSLFLNELQLKTTNKSIKILATSYSRLSIFYITKKKLIKITIRMTKPIKWEV